ncbi:MAG TPA: Dyp-type peroxidase [Urbifossiella sp.]|nr:Dyp-type peroxidase [Urbifossiella sp.]
MAPTDRPPAPGRAVKARSAREPLLDVHDIQGNVLAGFNKDHQLLTALTIRDVAAARQWLRRVAPHVSSLAEVHQFNGLFRMRRARVGRDPAGLVATWVNVAFSYPGLATLTSPAAADGVPDAPFRAGLPGRAGVLGDAAPGGRGDPTAGWVVGGTGRVPDVLLIVASDDPDELAKAAARVRPGAGDGPGAPEVVWEELGQTRPDLPGHEHFGFKDGVSQPGVRGLVSQRPDVFLTPRLLAPSAAGGVESARPGQPLVWPGQFVFGYPSTDGASGSTGGPVPPGKLKPAWLRNGSLLVFRRLRQDVAAFAAFVTATAAALAATPEFAGMTPARRGALLVGRWPSWAPVPRAPQTDLPALAACPLSNNDFLFAVNTPPPVFRPGAAGPPPFPPAAADPHGFICPHAAHIRKVNPRDQDSDLGDQFDTLTRRILRRGTPYGPPLADPSADDGVDRGLHFLCYQTSIEEQFEKLQVDWANSTGAPQAGGHDLVIGQTADGVRGFDLSTPDGASVRPLTAPRQWVTPTGGGYFFAPSISAIRDVLGGGAVA